MFRLVRETVGHQAEEYVAHYAAFEWNRSAIAGYLDQLSMITPLDRTVILMRLANRLENSLDDGDLYCPNAEQRLRNIQQHGGFTVSLASGLGFPSLASELNEAFTAVLSAAIPEGLQNPHESTSVYLLTPLSYRMRYPTAIARNVMKTIGRVTRVLRRLTKGV